MRVYNDHLDEYVEVTNRGHSAQPLTGWVLASLGGSQYYPMPTIVLLPWTVIRIHTGVNSVHRPPEDWAWTQDNVWNNGRDVAILFDAEGREVCRHGYPSSRRAGPSFHKAKLLISTDGELHIVDQPMSSRRAGRTTHSGPHRRAKVGGSAAPPATI
jgi:hypothetical protein